MSPMSESTLKYAGPGTKALGYDRPVPPWWRKIPVAFILVVILPTILGAVYYLLIASPMYVSEARFVVRAPAVQQPSTLGVALQGVGLTPGQTDAFSVHEYINSRDSLKELSQRNDLDRIFGAPGSDPIARYPSLGGSRSQEDLYRAFKRFVVVGYDSTTGISTLKVTTFSPRDSLNLSEALLAASERLVNRLNQRASSDAVADAARARDEARRRLTDAQSKLTVFRNRQQFIDPTRAAAESAALIGNLLSTAANLRAEREQLLSEAPQSPQLSALNGRISAYDRQIANERAKVAGSDGSLAPRVGEYEDLILDRELGDKELTQATAALLTAEQDARRQRLYLDRVVNPSLPDKSTQPRRFIGILTIFLSALMLYGVGWLLWAGVREHRQD